MAPKGVTGFSGEDMIEPWISLDFETRSRVDIRSCGAYRYAEDSSTEVLVIAVSMNGEKPVTWDIRQPVDVEANPALRLLNEAIRNEWLISAFNSQFEWAILKYVCTRQFGFPVPNINRLRCSSALCRSAGLPPSLAAAAEFLRLPVQKDKMGKALIQKFSVPQKKDDAFINHDDDISFTVGGEKLTAAAAFQAFVDYCVRDVETEVAVTKAMQPFELKGDILEYFLMDARMNDRGVPVHRRALENAYALYQEHESDLMEEFQKITGLMPSQTARTKEWLQERGYKGDSLNVETRERFGNDPSLSEEAKRALDIRAELSFAAVKKIPTMLDWIMSDDRIRGSFLWCGAQKTWRWTSKGPQWQNMKKPKKSLRPLIEQIFNHISEGIHLELLQWGYGNPYEIIASLSRYFVRFPDTNILDADFSSVEAKILPMLIGCDRILKRFGTGEDLYVTTAAAMSKEFGEELTRDHGKTIVLATQFGGGWRAVFTATGKTWSREKCEKAAAIVRKENPEFPEAWTKFQNAFVEALDKPGKWHEATEYVSYAYTLKPPFPRMLMRLPSGRRIVMPYPRKEPFTMCEILTWSNDGPKRKVVKREWESVPGHWSEREILERKLDMGDAFLRGTNVTLGTWFPTWEISFYGHTENGHYGRVKTYGGSELQTATQATGVDLLAQGALEAERRGFLPFLLVHDQCLAPVTGPEDDFTNALCTVPEWFKGFPLEAETKIERSYCKS